MSKIYVDDDDTEIDVIAWVNSDGEEEYISNCASVVTLNLTGYDGNSIHKSDIPKLIKALEKAIELDWMYQDD